VILLWPPILGDRLWDSTFFTPLLMQMPARAILEEQLPREAVDRWLDGLNVARALTPSQPSERARKPWWRFW